MVTILIVDDHALIRNGLTQALADLDYHGEEVSVLAVSSAEEAIDLLPTNDAVDMMVVDLMLPGMGGMGLLGALGRLNASVPVLVMSGLDDIQTVQRVMSLGASGFAPKTTDTKDILIAIRSILDGKQYIPEKYRLDSATPSIREVFGLSKARFRVLELLIEGKSNREIADLLSITEGTAKLHVASVLKAMKVSSRAQAVTLAGKHGMAAPSALLSQAHPDD